MSMLAEPRRKQRIGPNPRGKYFADQDNIGKSLLQKMGWKTGEGLGTDRQGISEAIKPKIQMSSKGLGYDPKSNPWIEHNQEFEEILKGLNANPGVNVSIKVESQEKLGAEDGAEQDIKLEKKSKASRARIHYHRFVKGKDLSQASSDDMKSIFGCSGGEVGFDYDAAYPAIGNQDNSMIKDTFNTTEESKGEDDQEETANSKHESNTINRGSMVDYFKQKMEAKRNKQEEAPTLVKEEGRKKLKVEKDEEPVETKSTLEEQLKMEMEHLKSGKQRKKQEYFSSLGSVSKKFRGANIDKIKGYTLY